MPRSYSRCALKLAEQVIYKLCRGNVIDQDNLGGVEEFQALLLATLRFAQLYDSTKIFFRKSDGGPDKSVTE
jgi:hypothetical protein